MSYNKFSTWLRGRQLKLLVKPSPMLFLYRKDWLSAKFLPKRGLYHKHEQEKMCVGCSS